MSKKRDIEFNEFALEMARLEYRHKLFIIWFAVNTDRAKCYHHLRGAIGQL